MLKALVQLSLDFFGEPRRPAVTPAPRAPAPPAAVPAAPPAAALPPGLPDHPDANRDIVLDGRRVRYQLRRARRRSIGMQVGAEGLRVSAPTWVAQRDIEAALQEKAGWIVRKLIEMGQRAERQAARRIAWRHGGELPYLGQPVRLALVGSGRVALQPGTEDTPATLRLPLPPDAPAEDVQQQAEAWLKRQARDLFAARLDHYAPLLGVRWTRLALSSAGTRWGSASVGGAIRLNWRLMHLRLALIDYVVVHELSHLRVMDHSPRFWAVVASVMPDHARLRAELREDAVPREV